MFDAMEKVKEKNTDRAVQRPERFKEHVNHTGIPTQLKERLEESTGVSFDDVRVRYNSDLPARLDALAYTQGNRVEIAPGQERHLPHELGHVVQQKLGLVRANAMHPSGVAMNTEAELEYQADEIGAGKKIGRSSIGNAGMNVVQRYIIIDNCTFAQAPDGQNRKVMVKNGEPATIYFDQSVVDSIGKVLAPLGIRQTEDYKEFAHPQTKEKMVFCRFTQGQIPDITPKTQKNEGYAIQTPQPERSKQEIEYAMQIMNKQAEIINVLYTLTDNLVNDIKSGNITELVQKIIDITTKIVKMYHDPKQKFEFLAMHSLGNDITLDILTLRKIAKLLSDYPPIDFPAIENADKVDNVEISGDDIKHALNIVREDFAFRKSQVEKECDPNICRFVPQISTGCDLSAQCRKDLGLFDPFYVFFAKAELGEPPNGGHIFNWNWHYATPIPLNDIKDIIDIIGPNDRLFIEDAVGNSSTANECANAHWVARIYGQSEEENSNFQASGVETNNQEVDGYKWLECRFNHLSENLREKFLQYIKINKRSVLVLRYQGEEQKTILKIVVRKNQMMYKINSQLEPYIRHFAMDVAKSVLDRYVLQVFALADEEVQEELKEIENDGYNFIQIDMDKKSFKYSLEKIHLKND